jgi:type II secretory pathway pseudopilin PulG
MRAVPTTWSGPSPALARRDAGDTLIEILLTVVIVGLTVGALLSSMAAAGNGGRTQRTSVQMDIVMRNYAEATKAAVLGCTEGASYSVDFEAPPHYAVATHRVEYTPAAGFTVTPEATATTDVRCPTVIAANADSPGGSIAYAPILQLDVTGPSKAHETMQIEVRTP